MSLRSAPEHTLNRYSGSPAAEQDDAGWDLINRMIASIAHFFTNADGIAAAFFSATMDEGVRAGESLDNLAKATVGGYMHPCGCITSSIA